VDLLNPNELTSTNVDSWNDVLGKPNPKSGDAGAPPKPSQPKRVIQIFPENGGKGYCDPQTRIQHGESPATADDCNQLCLKTASCVYATWQDQYGGQCHLTPACSKFTHRSETTTWHVTSSEEAVTVTPSPSFSRLRNCQEPCTDGAWSNSNGQTCQSLRDVETKRDVAAGRSARPEEFYQTSFPAIDMIDVGGVLASDACCQYCPADSRQETPYASIPPRGEEALRWRVGRVAPPGG
jgi:hypothetical protein